MESIQQSPEERFLEFYKTFKDSEGEYKYRKRISQMAVLGLKSLVVDFDDLLTFDRELGKRLVEEPDRCLGYAGKSAFAQISMEDPEYAEQLEKVFVRFRRLPDKQPLRKIGSDHIGSLVSVDGIVVRATQVKPIIVKAAFKCRRCGEMTKTAQSGAFLRGPALCPYCKFKGLDLSFEDSSFINLQELRVQERPEDLPPGQLPRSIDILLTEDLVDVARPGDRVTITGIVRVRQEYLTRAGRLRTSELYLEANFIDIPSRETEVVDLTPEEEEKIKGLARDPWILMKLIASIAPSVYGYQHVKEAILYLLFGGVRKILPDGVVIRGDVNVLLVGDPGTAKSVLLQYVARIAPRGLYTSGRGSTAAGLTAAVLREKAGGMVLEAGALVLADKGVASIDEIDKMRPEDRVSIHEAMEQQTVSVAKGGIVATLNARAAILAAANPALGRYDPYRLVSENINLPITILSRFDLIFVMRDIPDVESDSKMSEHMLTLHRLGGSPEEPPIPPDLLRKYISYAKRIEPKLSEEAASELRNYYLKMRSVSALSTESPIAITPRQLEALVRLSEARARAFLRDKVTVEDARAVIGLMNASLQDVGIDTRTGQIDIDVIMTGKPKSLRDVMQAVLTNLSELDKEVGMVEESRLIEELSEAGFKDDEVRKAITQLSREGLIYSPKPGYLKKTST
ncbi:MAG: minichromosome maintenance protein MCM [Candidatus Bathyarchaeia archaeon]